MSSNPHDPIHEIPVTEIMPPGSSSIPARHSSSDSSARERSLPAAMIPLPARPKRSCLPWLIGIAMVTVVSGVGLWLWWTAGPPPVKYTTMPVDRGPITAIVTATGTVNPVVSVLVGSQVSGKLAKILAVSSVESAS